MNKIMKTPRSVDIEITNRCNLRCKYCSHFDSSGDVGIDLPTEEWLRFFEELNFCAVMEVTLSGGEPFCRDDFRELLTGIIKNRMRYSILSNGTMISDEMARFIASTHRCNGIQISLDGSIPKIHDACRGIGSFERAMQGIYRLMSYKLPLTVRVTINRHNVKYLENIADFLLEEIKLPSFSTNNATHFGLCKSNAEQVQLTPDEHYFAMKTLQILNKKYSGRIHAQAGPLANFRAWNRMKKGHTQGLEETPSLGHLTSCAGPNTKIAVRSDGVIVPCNQLGHIELGRINKDELKEIWHHHPQLIRLRERHKIPLTNFEFCRECDYIRYCRGGCPAVAYNLLGNEYHPSPDSCLRRFLVAHKTFLMEEGE
jgi:SynChlorMet cassette radical SAM/SPASM protein ScmE